MARTHTHTVATLEISREAFDEIRSKLHSLGPDYDRMLIDSETIDMTSVGLERRGSRPRLREGSQCVYCSDPGNIQCRACAKGSIHMNVAEPFPGYTSERTGEIDWPAHNARGSHHVMWNGSENETVPCGSKRADELADRIIGKDAIETPAKRMDKMVDHVVAGLANARQVAGSHYSGYPLQHWDLVAIFDWDYFQGQITKYLMRWKKKNGIQDLEKAAHFLEKYIEVEKGKLGQVTKETASGPGGSGGSGGISR